MSGLRMQNKQMNDGLHVRCITACVCFSTLHHSPHALQFMAPEIYEEKYDEKVDIYSFGM